MPSILILPGPSRKTHPPKVGDFVWSDKHQEYIWQGRELSDEEFNQAAPDVIERNIGRWSRPVVPRILTRAKSKERTAHALNHL